MIKVEHIEVFNFEGAIRGCRNAMNSWSKSDSKLCKGKDFDDCTVDCVKCPRKDENFDNDIFCIGKADLDLMHRLYIAGQPHRKYLRQIFVSMDVIAPLYWWKEADTYKVGTTANSCSTMHKIHDKEFTLDDFSHEHLIGDFEPIEHRKYAPDDFLVIYSEREIPIKSDTVLLITIETLNFYRNRYLETKDKKYWWQMIQLLPSSYNQRRTLTLNYENVANMIEYRSNHKLDEWNEFVNILWELPYLKEIAGKVEE